MAEDGHQPLYDAQIDAVVHGFVQVWNRFEAVLSKELSQIQGSYDGMSPEKHVQPNENYELFYRVSSSIYGKGNPTMGELSSGLSVPLSTATRIVDWLVDKHYVQRLPDPDDRRVVRIALTGFGEELHQAMDGYIRRRLQQILSCLTSAERATLLGLVGKVVLALKEKAG